MSQLKAAQEHYAETMRISTHTDPDNPAWDAILQAHVDARNAYVALRDNQDHGPTNKEI